MTCADGGSPALGYREGPYSPMAVLKMRSEVELYNETERKFFEKFDRIWRDPTLITYEMVNGQVVVRMQVDGNIHTVIRHFREFHRTRLQEQWHDPDYVYTHVIAPVPIVRISMASRRYHDETYAPDVLRDKKYYPKRRWYKTLYDLLTGVKHTH